MAKTLGRKLWDAIQTPQGFAFIADNMDDWPDEKVIERAQDALEWEREAVRVLSRFIRRHAPNTASKRPVKASGA